MSVHFDLVWLTSDGVAESTIFFAVLDQSAPVEVSLQQISFSKDHDQGAAWINRKKNIDFEIDSSHRYGLLNWLGQFIYRARDIATFVRFGHATMPSFRRISIFIRLLSVRTVEIRMIFFSSPWNSSTLPTIIGYFSWANNFRSVVTCKWYGVMTPMSSLANLSSSNAGMNCIICNRHEKYW